MKSKDINTLLSMKYNLFQNFYIIGYSLSDFYSSKTKNIYTFQDIFTDSLNVKLNPKLISKFPSSIKNINSIPDDLVISHCFPNGLKILNNPFLISQLTHFEFNLENIPANYTEEDKFLYSKIYFNCLEFYEPLSQYLKLKKEILSQSTKNKIQIEPDKTSKENLDIKNYYLPKIICFASLFPYSNEIKEILYNIYNFYRNNIITDNNNINNLLSIEKIVEQIIMKTPLPFSSNAQTIISFKLNNIKKNIQSIDKIKFPVYNLKESYIKNYTTISFGELFNYFSIEDIMKIFKYIILEIPLLFFCKNKNVLSLFIDNFISLLNPFCYVLPHISLLPYELYGLINSEQKFIFGINEEYSKTFFEDNNIDLDKSIVIVQLNHLKKNESKIIEIIKNIEAEECLVINEKIKQKENDKNTEENIFFNNQYINLLNIELPSKAKKKAISKMNNLITLIKKKGDLSDIKYLYEQKFNYHIQHIFFKFFIYLMAGYTDYLLNSKFFSFNIKNKDNGENIRFKNTDEDFIKEIFNLNEFILSKSKDELFYIAFCKTKLFFNFFREKIYSNNALNKVRYELFDEFIFLKKHKDFRKKKENKGLYENLSKHTIEQEPITQNYEIIINNELFHTKQEITELIKDNNQYKLLTSYGQNIISKNKKNKLIENPNISYYIFPKLIFDDSFFDEKFENLFQSHNNNIPGMSIIDELKKRSIVFSDTNTKYRKYMHINEIITKLPLTNNSQENFEITYKNYIYYSWLILQSCSLWYCEQRERNIRIDKILEILNKLDYVEEQVLYFLFINIYKYGNKYHFIKLHKINLKYYGYSNYYFLYLLYNKIKEKENKEYPDINSIEENNEENIIESDEEKEDEYILKRRYLINTDNQLIKDLLKKGNYRRRNSELNNDKEEIVFSTEQFCEKCGNVINIIPDEIIKNKLMSNLDFYKYKCEKCNGNEYDIVIKYQKLLSNLNKKEAIIVGEGEFKLCTTYKFYLNILYFFQKRKKYELNIENIFNEKEINLILIIFYFSVLNLSFDFLLPYKNDETNNTNSKNEENKENNEFVPIKINYDNDDVYRRFNNLIGVYTTRRKYFRKNNNPIEPFTIQGQKQKQIQNNANININIKK